MSIDCARTPSWMDISDHAPMALWQSMNHMIATEKTQFILSAFRCQYVAEWGSLYEHVANFVTNMLQLYESKRYEIQAINK
jgi:hypothetical protein